MINTARKEKPTESGWYVWWDNEQSKHPFYVLAHVKLIRGIPVINLDFDSDKEDYVSIEKIADRLWLKVS